MTEKKDPDELARARRWQLERLEHLIAEIESEGFREAPREEIDAIFDRALRRRYRFRLALGELDAGQIRGLGGVSGATVTHDADLGVCIDFEREASSQVVAIADAAAEVRTVVGQGVTIRAFDRDAPIGEDER